MPFSHLPLASSTRYFTLCICIFLGAITNYNLEIHTINFIIEILINITGIYFTHSYRQWDKDDGSVSIFL